MLKEMIPINLRCRLADLRGRGAYSGYADKYKCVYIHIPKNAGTALFKSLFDTPLTHKTYREYEIANPLKFKKYFKFTIVRNPWDRLYSGYTFLKSGGMTNLDREWSDEYLAEYSDFNSFVKKWVNRENIFKWIHFYPQCYFVCDDQLKLKMDFVGRFESLDKDVSVIQKKLGLPIRQVPKINVTKRVDSYIDQYDEESIAIVKQVYADDIRIFSYSFDNH